MDDCDSVNDSSTVNNSSVDDSSSSMDESDNVDDKTSFAAPSTELVLGMALPSQAECTRLVKKVALTQSKEAKVDPRSGGCSVMDFCSSSTPFPFTVWFSQVRNKDMRGFRLIKLNLTHSNCNVVARPTARQASRALLEHGTVHGNAAVSDKAMRETLVAAAGMDVHIKTANRARDDAVGAISVDYAEGFLKLRSLATRFCSENPTSHADVVADSNGCFQRAFLSNPIARNFQQHGQAILGVDGTFHEASELQKRHACFHWPRREPPKTS